MASLEFGHRDASGVVSAVSTLQLSGTRESQMGQPGGRVWPQARPGRGWSSEGLQENTQLYSSLIHCLIILASLGINQPVTF